MKFELIIREDSIIILKLNGDMIADSVNEEIITAVESEIMNGAKSAVVNIEGVNYINSVGIGLLITLLTKFRNKGGDLCLINPSEHAKKLLIITKLQNIFNIAASEDEALSSLGK